MNLKTLILKDKILIEDLVILMYDDKMRILIFDFFDSLLNDDE